MNYSIDVHPLAPLLRANVVAIIYALGVDWSIWLD